MSGHGGPYDGSNRTERTHASFAYDPALINCLAEETTYLAENDGDPLTTSYTYDTLGRVTRVDRTRSGTTITVSETTYDDTTNEALTKNYRSDSEYVASLVDKDWSGRPEKESAWTGTNQTGTRLDTLYSYDKGGRLIQKTLPSGEEYEYTYYGRSGKLYGIKYPDDRGIESFDYDRNGNLVSSTDLNGNVTTLTYNPAGLVSSKTVSRNSLVEETVQMTYCQYGPLTVTKAAGTSTLPDVSCEYLYALNGTRYRETRTVYIDGNAVSSYIDTEFDDTGHLGYFKVSGLSGYSKTICPSFHWFTNDVNGTTEFSTTVFKSGGGVFAKVSMGRKGLSSMTYGNGLATTYAYDDWLGLSAIDHPGTAYDQSYARDYTGKIASWTNSSEVRSFTYDGLGRLSEGEGVSYAYDTAGNMTTATGGDPSAFEYQLGAATGADSMLIDSTMGAATVDYSTDVKGNVVQATGRYGEVTYDFSNRVTAIEDTARGVTDTYDYDAMGLRYKKTETIDGEEVTTYTAYYGSEIILEETYSGGQWKKARIGVPLEGMIVGGYEKDFQTDEETLLYYYKDHLGSRVGVADEAGNMLATVDYDVWGNATATGEEGYDAEGEIRFTGKSRDATGLYYFNARYYDPQSKRFLSEDPIRQGVNWYAYCGNDPVNTIDPWGLEQAPYGPNPEWPGTTPYTPGIGNNDGDPGDSGGSVESVPAPEVPEVSEIPDVTPTEESTPTALPDPESTLGSGLSSIVVTTVTESAASGGPSDSPSATPAPYNPSTVDPNAQLANTMDFVFSFGLEGEVPDIATPSVLSFSGCLSFF